MNEKLFIRNTISGQMNGWISGFEKNSFSSLLLFIFLFIFIWILNFKYRVIVGSNMFDNYNKLSLINNNNLLRAKHRSAKTDNLWFFLALVLTCLDFDWEHTCDTFFSYSVLYYIFNTRMRVYEWLQAYDCSLELWLTVSPPKPKHTIPRSTTL